MCNDRTRPSIFHDEAALRAVTRSRSEQALAQRRRVQRPNVEPLRPFVRLHQNNSLSRGNVVGLHTVDDLDEVFFRREG